MDFAGQPMQPVFFMSWNDTHGKAGGKILTVRREVKHKPYK